MEKLILFNNSCVFKFPFEYGSGGLGMVDLSNKIMETSSSMEPGFLISHLCAESSYILLCSEEQYISYSNLQLFATILSAHITAGL